MKRSLSLVLITLLFVILGCSLDRLTGKKDETPPTAPVNNTSQTADNKTDSGDTKSGSESADSADLTLDKFNKIEVDMPYDDVKGIIGSDGNEKSSTKSGSYESKSYQWKGDKYAQINVRFRNGKLVFKNQANLGERKGDADLSQDKFNKVNTGMSYSEVKGILGSEGEMTSLTKLTNSTMTTYIWKGPKSERIYTSYKDDKLTNKNQSGLK